MSLGQNICLTIANIVSAYWTHFFFTIDQAGFEEQHGKQISGQVVFLIYFQDAAFKRVALQHFTIIYGGCLYAIYSYQSLFVPELYTKNSTVLAVTCVISFIGGFVLSAAPTKQKKL